MKSISRDTSTDKRADLLRRLSGSAVLVDYIRQLPATTLVRLIDEVGLEDSQEIIAAMDAQQFQETMSIALWSSAAAGHDEVLDVNQLVRWIALWIGEGDAVLSRHIMALGEDLIVACFRQVLFAADRTTVGVRGQGVEIGNYVVSSKEPRHWRRIVEALVALWGHEPDFLLRVLRRCSHERSILSETRDEYEAQNAELQDLTAARAAQRAHVGYVSPQHAALFLSSTKTAPLQDLCALRVYDLNTADYLARAERLGQGSERGVPGDDPRESSEAQRGLDPDRTSEFSALDELLREAGVLDSRADVTLLTDQRVTSATLCLEQAIAILAAASPEVASRRMRELAYLANVLKSGAESQGKPYTATLAARTAMAVANLGATFLLRDRGSPSSDVTRVSEMIERDPGVVRLFQIGFNLLAHIPGQCCEAVYRAKDVQSRRRGHLVYLEMEEILGASTLIDLVSEGRYAEAKSVIDELTAVMDSAACVALRILIDPIPAYPNVLGETAAAVATYVDRGHRPVATVADLERIASFLATLADCCGN